jgi:Virus neck protein
MPTRHYIQGGLGIGTSSEQNLLQVLVNEAIESYGIDLVYIPRNLVKLDDLFHEDTLSSFTKNFTIEMYVENYDAYTGIGPQITNWGFQLQYQLRLIVSREKFAKYIGNNLPVEGDLIYNPVTKGLFEIKFIEDKNPLFPLGSRQYFVLACETFKYSDETMDSGTNADSVQDNWKNNGGLGASGISDPFAKNQQIEDVAEGVVNNVEQNPFG